MQEIQTSRGHQQTCTQTTSESAGMLMRALMTIRREMRGLALVLGVLALSVAARGQVVISAVYGGGGSSVTGYNADFVELFNYGTTAVNFATTPYTLQYASSAGSSWASIQITINTGTIPARGFFLVRTQTTQTLGLPLPSPDFLGTAIDLAAANGKIVLYSAAPGTNTGTCPVTTNLADFVGYGSANCAEPIASPAAAPVISGTTYLFRTNIALGDTNNNANDFSAVSCINRQPRNSASPTLAFINGTAESAAYGTALATQNTQTSFGDATTVTVSTANGSELDAAYGYVCNNVLYLSLAGNLQSNGNRLVVMIDSVSGAGQSPLRGDNPGSISRMGVNGGIANSGGAGMTFMSGFVPDYYFAFNISGSTPTLFVDFGSLPTNNGGTSNFLGSTTTFGAGPGTLTGGNYPTFSGSGGVLASFNNSNTAGVTAGTGSASGSGVTTGLEVAIPLNVIGSPTGTFTVFAFIVDSNFLFGANQSLGACNQCSQFNDSSYRNWSTTGTQAVSVPRSDPVITTQPVSVSVCSGGTANLSVVASGSNLSYLWQSSTNNGVTWSTADVTTQTASTTTGVISTNLQYRCLVTNGCGQAISSTATVTSNPLPSPPTGTTAFNGTVGTPITMSVTVGSGIVADWFTGSCGGTLVNTGNSFTVTPTIGGVTTYLVRSRNTTTNCTSLTCTSVVLTVPVPNDQCSGAVSLALNTPVDGTLDTAAANYQVPTGVTSFSGAGQITSVSGSLGRDAVYTFTPASSGRYSVRVYNGRSTSDFVLYMTNACPAGTSVTFTQSQVVAASNRNSNIGGLNSAPASEELYNIQLTAGTQYWIIVDEAALSTPASTFTIEVNPCSNEVEPNETPATATAYVFGSSGMEGTNTTTTDIDFFSLGTPASGSRVFAMVDTVSSNSGDSALRVTTATDTLEYDDDDGDLLFGLFGWGSVVAGTPTTGAATYLRVNRSSILEPYRLYAVVQPPSANAAAEVEPNDSTATASSNASNYFSGTCSGTSDVDTFSFSGTIGQLLFVALDCAPNRTTAAFDGVLTLLDSSGNVLLNVDGITSTSTNTTSGAGNLASSTPTFPGEALAWRARYTGTYFVRVTANSSTTFPAPYLLSVTTSPAAINGACCNSLTCTLTTDLACQAGFGVFQGLASTCSPNPCLPTGACCSSLGVCQVLTQPSCVATSGSVYLGNGVACTPTPCLTGTGALNNASPAQGCQTLITVTAAPGSSPASTGITATANLSAIGGSPAQTLFDNGTNGDVTAGDNIFSFRATVATNTTVGAKSLSFSLSDTQGRSFTGSLPTLTVAPYYTLTPVAATGTPGASVTFTVNVTEASGSPSGNTCTASSGRAVTIDLTTLGGSNNVAMSEGPAGTWTVSYVLPITTAFGTSTVPVSIGDSGGRSAIATISVAIRPSNDECAGAIVLNNGATNGLSIAGATTSLPTWGCASTQAQNDVWFRYTNCAAGLLVIDTCGSRNSDGGNGIDTVLQVFSGSCGSLTSVGCNDEHTSTITGCSSTNNNDSRVSFTATAGTTYFIRVARYSTTGTDKFNLRISGPQIGDPTSPGASPATVCQGTSCIISAAVGSGGDQVQWFTGSCGGTPIGTGASLTVSPSVTTIYYARSFNSVTGCVSTGCATVTVTVVPPPTANAGSPQTICASGTATLNGTATNAASTTWTTSGDGTFNDASLLNAVYTPGVNDRASGGVTLTLTANANSPCSNATSQVLITLQPLPIVSAGGSTATICAGDTVTLSGSASFVSSFFWSTSGDGTFNDSGSLSAVYTPGPSDVTSGSVTLTLTGLGISPCSTPASSARVVTIRPTTAIVSSPSSQSICTNQPVNFSVSATGASLTYQWRKGGININGANAPSFSIASVTSGDAGNYDCVVTGACGLATSASATLTVKDLTAITGQPPTSASQCSDTSTTFGVSAAGSMLTYAWQQSLDNGLNWGPATGINTGSSYTTSTQAVDATRFRCVVSGECGPSVTSSEVTLIVNTPPTIDSQPVSTLSACIGQSPTLTVGASGFGPFTFAWEYSIDNGVNWNPAPGTNALASYTLPAVVATDAGNLYRVTVSNSCGSTTSGTSTLSLGGSVNLALTVQLQNVVPGPFTRCITVTIYDGNCPGGTNYSVPMTFTGGLATANVALSGCSSPTGIAVRDAKHTLRRVALAGTPAFNTSNPNNLVGVFDASTNKVLIGGNVNDDDFVDILDFGGYVGQISANVGADSSCTMTGLHPDFSGNGLIDTADFTFIASNFLSAREADPCGSPIRIEPNQPGGPWTDVSVFDLARVGLWDSARADLTRDGRLNMDDAIFAAANGLPTCTADFNGVSGVSVQDIFDFMNAWMSGHPAADTNRDRFIGVQDIFDFLAAWFAGC